MGIDPQLYFLHLLQNAFSHVILVERGEQMKKRIARSSVLHIILIITAIAAAMLCRQLDRIGTMQIFGIIRSLIYIFMFLIWGITLRNRIVQIQAKRFMTSIAGLIVFWVAIRSVKFVIAQSPFAVRMLWYMYYIPMIFIPMFALLVALSLGKPENYRLPAVTSLLYVASVLMVIFVLTNDLHCLVFRFPGEREMWDDRDYSYAGGYYIVAGYMLLCTIGAFVTLISKCRIPKERKTFIMPLLPVVAMVIYTLLYVSGEITGGTFIHRLAGDMTVTVSLLTALSFECCIQCGLIRSNTYYIQLLQPCTVPALITDNDYNILLSSDCAEKIDREIMQMAKSSPVMLSNGKRLSSAKIKGGYVLWLDDLSELIEVNDKLAEAKDDLKDDYDLICEEYDLRNREAHILERDRIYDRISRETSGQIAVLNSLTDRFELSEDEDERRKLLGKMVVIGAYLKRRNNLIFISERSSMISEKELYLAFLELTDNLELYGVTCGLNIRLNKSVPAVAVMEMFDTFEKMIELSLDNLSAVNISVTLNGGIFTMTVTAESSTDFNVMNGDFVTAVCDDDGEWQIVYRREAGRCKA